MRKLQPFPQEPLWIIRVTICDKMSLHCNLIIISFQNENFKPAGLQRYHTRSVCLDYRVIRRHQCSLIILCLWSHTSVKIVFNLTLRIPHNMVKENQSDKCNKNKQFQEPFLEIWEVAYRSLWNAVQILVGNLRFHSQNVNFL